MNDRTNPLSGILSCIALLAIAGNMTVQNLRTPTANTEPPKPQESVVEVVGRVTIPFDGFGSDAGFLVKDGNDLKMVRCDAGSVMGNKNFRPKYLAVTESISGHVYVDSIIVDPIRDPVH